MACINMYNPDGAAGFGGGPQPPAALGPRISFSSDFAVEPPPPVQNRAMSLRCQEEDLNFEFSVGSYPMMAADQLFSKDRILLLKGNGALSSVGRTPCSTTSSAEAAPATTTRGPPPARDPAGGRRCSACGRHGPAALDGMEQQRRGLQHGER